MFIFYTFCLKFGVSILRNFTNLQPYYTEIVLQTYIFWSAYFYLVYDTNIKAGAFHNNWILVILGAGYTQLVINGKESNAFNFMA